MFQLYGDNLPTILDSHIISWQLPHNGLDPTMFPANIEGEVNVTIGC